MNRVTRARIAFTLVELLVVLAIVGVLVALLLPAVQAARESARRSQCSNHLRQIGLAIAGFHDNEGGLPDAPKGEPSPAGILFGPSNHLLLLPFLEEQNLADLYNQSLPWNLQSPEFVSQTIPILLCPSSPSEPIHSYPLLGSMGLDFPSGETYGMTHYVFSKGSADGWCLSGRVSDEDRGPFEMNRECRFAQVTDGLSQTFAMGEGDTIFQLCLGASCDLPLDGVLATQGWAVGEPGYDVLVSQGFVVASAYATTVEPLNKKPVTASTIRLSDLSDCRSSHEGGPHTTSNFRSSHPGGAFFLYLDNSVRFVADGIDMAVYQSCSTIDGGEIK